jgi:hypothetical protein
MVAIVMLEFHYVADLFGGIAAALLAIFMVDRASRVGEHGEKTAPLPG